MDRMPKDLREYQKQFEEFEDALAGFEHENNDSDDEVEDGVTGEHPFDADKIRIDSKILPLTYLMTYIDNGRLDLSPEFQRNKVWDDKRKSLLIESLMLRIPIPAFYFYEDEESNKFVIDGLQRLSTIHDFIKGKFKLRDLQYLGSEYNGCGIDKIKPKHLARMDETLFTINIIDARNPPQIKYDIFRRVNTGGMPLKPQEIRNIVSHKSTRYLLKELADSDEFKLATRNRVSDLRMDAQELILKFLLYYRCYDIQRRRPIFQSNNLQNLLDNEIEIINTLDKEELNNYYRCFINAMRRAIALFGEESFSKPGFSHIINKALFISWGVVLARSNFEISLLELKKSQAMITFRSYLNSNYYYATSLTSSTNSPNNIKRQFDGVYSVLEAIMND